MSKITFATMMSVLQRQYSESHKKGDRKTKVTIFKRICIFFAYYRDVQQQILLQNTLLRTVRLSRYSLGGKYFVVDKRFHLPSKRILLKENIDSTECQILLKGNFYLAVHDFRLFKLSRLPFRKNTLVVILALNSFTKKPKRDKQKTKIQKQVYQSVLQYGVSLSSGRKFEIYIFLWHNPKSF